MNRTEEIELLKRELFKIEIALRKKQFKDSEEHKNILEKKKIFLEKMSTLQEEVALDDGQVGFAFTDLIEKKGKKI